MYKRLDFSHERDLSYDELERRVKSYYPDADLGIFHRAYHFAQKAHRGQKRSSGEDYFTHPCNVAAILIKLRVDMDSLVAGLLHDVLEDCHCRPEDIDRDFSPAVTQIVVGLTKISQIEFQTREESQAENFRKMVVAMAKDLRVIIVKLADRMHNMRTLQYINEEKQKKIAQETLDIYVPLAGRLGINSVKSELEDLSFRFLHPEIYYRLAEKVAMNKSQRDRYIEETINTINEKLLEYSVKASLLGRPKHFYSIFKKMNQGKIDVDQIQDMLAFRVIVDNITECYKVLGIVHSHFTPIPGRFKDYIAIPKVNGYQALHTTVIGPKVERIEIQIRTNEMDKTAEVGVAAHWKYKEAMALKGKTNLGWIEELLEFNKGIHNNDFIKAIKRDLDVGDIFVFTPKGDVLELGPDATVLDFAYTIHTGVGHKTIGAKVNGKMVPLRYVLQSGDTVEILTNKNQTPSRNWTSVAKTSRARAKIRQWFLRKEKEEYREIGKEILNKTLRVFKTSIKGLKANNNFEKMITQSKALNEDDFYTNIGLKKIDLKEFVKKFSFYQASGSDEKKKIEKMEGLSPSIIKMVKGSTHKGSAIIVGGIQDVVVRLARCCSPIPGDAIIGLIKGGGRGISVHTQDCESLAIGEISKTVEAEWNPHFTFKHPVSIRIMAHDRPGILSTISKEISKGEVNIRSAQVKSTLDRKGSFIFEVEVSNSDELSKIMGAVASLKEVISVRRA